MSLCFRPRRAGAERGHRQVRLRGPQSPRAVLQEGRVPPAVPPGLPGLVGGPAQRRGRPDTSPVHRGAGPVGATLLLLSPQLGFIHRVVRCLTG